MIKKVIIKGVDHNGSYIQEELEIGQESASSIKILNSLTAIDDQLVVQFKQYDIGEPLTQEILDEIHKINQK